MAAVSAAPVGFFCCPASKSFRAKGDMSGLIRECPSAGMSSMKRVQTAARRSEGRHEARSNAAAVLLQNLSSSNRSPVQEDSRLHSCDGHLAPTKVFEDEAKGICCYRSPTGKVTCEGYDEGPYFDPAECFPARAPEAKSWRPDSSSPNQEVFAYKYVKTDSSSPNQEVFAYKYVKGGQGQCWCEGKDES